MYRQIGDGPINVSLQADSLEFQAYTGGLFDSKDCGFLKTNLAALAVGFGTENGQDYILVRNSWGADWGENGYIRIASIEDECGAGICGISLFPLYVKTV